MDYASQRWMLKALHEASDELQSQLLGLSEEELCRRPAPDESSLKEIAFIHFSERDVVRHPLVQKIIQAYQKAESTAD